MTLNASIKKFSRSQLAASALTVVLVSLGVLGLRGLGALESVELAAYDWFLRLQSAGRERYVDPRVLIVTVSEGDIRALGRWPAPDEVIAQAIESVAKLKPRAIGLDIYRDIPIAPGTEQLHAAIERNKRVVGVAKFGGNNTQDVPAHPALRGTERVGFNDILVDPGGTVRRGLLFMDDGKSPVYAFALRLAMLYLRDEGISPLPSPDDPTHLKLGRMTIRPFEPNEGAYVGADARGYQFLLDFRGAKQAFHLVALGNLLAGSVDASIVRDKVVLIGVDAESVKDHFYTPHSRDLQSEQQFPGVAVHAHVVSQLLRIALDDERITSVPSRPQAVSWIVLWSIVGGLLGFWVRSPWRFSLIVSAGLGVIALAAYLAFSGGWWIPLVPAATAWLASAAIVTAYMSYRESYQRAALMRLFSRNVSREVAETIWQHQDEFLDGGRPRSEALVVTALFTDLMGFTTVSERIGPEVLMDWLNEYMDPMSEQVSKHGGVIRQYAGDSIVALFGVPVPRRTEGEIARDAENAVLCALAMEETLRHLNRRWQSQGRPMTGMRVGIFTGPAVAGTLGSAERSEYVVVGDTMNTASRLESFDKDLFPPDLAERPCRILIGEPTWKYLSDRFETERVGNVNLKGKEHSVAVYRVLGRRQESNAPVLTGAHT